MLVFGVVICAVVTELVSAVVIGVVVIECGVVAADDFRFGRGYSKYVLTRHVNTDKGSFNLPHTSSSVALKTHDLITIPEMNAIGKS